MGPIVVAFCVSYLGSCKVIPKRRLKDVNLRGPFLNEAFP